ncbi:MAG: NfeD family protein [Lachnospiraceae bacterium]|nr:NfeD family protein [Lachnospiraceae bacterium]
MMPFVIPGIPLLAAAVFLLVRQRRGRRPVEQPGDLRGREGIVTEAIDGSGTGGSVRIGDMEWKAGHFRGRHTLERGSVVRVMAVDGKRLLVESAGAPGKAEEGEEDYIGIDIL